MDKDADLRQVISPGKINLLRIEVFYCSEIGLGLYNNKVNPEKEDPECGGGRSSIKPETSSDSQKQWCALDRGWHVSRFILPFLGCQEAL